MTRRPLAMILAGALGAAAMMIAPVAATAQRGGHWHGGGRGDGRGDGGWGGGGPPGGGYRGDGYRDGPRGGYGRGGSGRGGPRGYYGRHHRCRDSGGGGTIIGAIAGGLLGNSIAGYGDRTAGTILGAGGGALVGRAIDRDC